MREDAGCWMLDAGYWILATGCWVLAGDAESSEMRSGYGDVIFGIRSSRFELDDIHSKFRTTNNKIPF